MKSSGDFTRIAFAYDALARLVFGQAIKKSQTRFLGRIKEDSRILILGGGTGWILTELDRLNYALDIQYIEPSAGMMQRSKSRDTGNLFVEFLPCVPSVLPETFDYVCAFFYLDIFTQENLCKEIKQIHHLLKPGGFLHFADFQLGEGWNRPWQIGLLNLMYLFFRITANIEATRLPDLSKEITCGGFSLLAEDFYYQRFITGKVYQKI